MDNVMQWMIEPYNKYFLLNFNDSVQIERDIEDDLLRRLWRCKWRPDIFQRSIVAWTSKRDIVEAQLTDTDAYKKLLCSALTMSSIFIKINFTGPPLETIDAYKDILKNYTENRYNPFIRLTRNTEEVNPNVQLGELLVIAIEMVETLLKKLPCSIILNWWKLRLLCLHQTILHELSAEIKAECKELINFLLAYSSTLQDLELEALLHLECANAYLQFLRGQKAEEVLNKLREKLKVSFSIQSLMGKRTRQQNPLPLLCLKVVQHDPQCLPSAMSTNGSTILPNMKQLKGDNFLDSISFVDEADNEIMTLPSVLQALILSTIKQLQRSQPKDLKKNEQREKIAPYLQTLIYQVKGPWSVRQAALLINCMQKGDERTVQRNWEQCKECLRMISAEPSHKLPERLSYGFASGLQPRWLVERQQCKLLISLDMMKSALDLSLRTQSLEDAILCCSRYGMRHNEENYVREEMTTRPTVLHYILFTEVTGSPDYFDVALAFLGKNSARVQAYWGHFMFKRGQYSEAIKHYIESIEINTLQELVLLRLGYSAFKTENWELAVRAYTSYTNLQPFGLEPWNYLAKALLNIENINRAHKILTEALKYNFGDLKVHHPLSSNYSDPIFYQILEDFLSVSIDINHFEDALDAYMHLSEHKDHYVDLEVLCLIVDALEKRKKGVCGTTQKKLKNKAINLLDRLCVRHKDESKLWDLASKLAPTPLNKALKLVKAYIALTTREEFWPKMQEFSLEALKICNDMCSYSLKAIRIFSENESYLMINAQLNTALLMSQACIQAVDGNRRKWPKNESILKNLKDQQMKLLQEINARNI